MPKNRGAFFISQNVIAMILYPTIEVLREAEDFIAIGGRMLFKARLIFKSNIVSITYTGEGLDALECQREAFEKWLQDKPDSVEGNMYFGHYDWHAVNIDLSYMPEQIAELFKQIIDLKLGKGRYNVGKLSNPGDQKKDCDFHVPKFGFSCH